MSFNSKMTAIADEIRTLSGTTGAIGLDAMASTLNTENASFSSNLETQDNLIAQIQVALEGKAAGGSTVGEMPVTIDNQAPYSCLVAYFSEDGAGVNGTVDRITTQRIDAYGGIVYIETNSNANVSVTNGTIVSGLPNGTMIHASNGNCVVNIIDSAD